jgi:molybdopterin-guanine dinucleotide biosynthesis protein A
MEITGIILAGGKSSRMGTDKGLLELNGKPMVQYVIDVLSKICTRVLIVSNNTEYKDFGCDVLEDIYKDKGPIGGIYTGLKSSKTEINLCVSCDTPNLNTDVFNFLLSQVENHEVILPSYQGRLHPLIGLYKMSCKTIFETQINNDVLKVETACKLLNYKRVELSEKDFEESIFDNINTLQDLNKINK